MTARTTRTVVQDHLDKRLAERFDDDLRDNYAEDVLLLTCTGVFRGLDGVRESKRILDDSLPRARFEIFNFLENGEFAFVEWRATADGAEVREGADSFIVRGGRIVAQSIHYKVQPESDAVKRKETDGDGSRRAVP